MRYPFNGSYRITQHFGENPASYSQFGLKGHNGIDFGLPTGTEVIATHGGKVIEATSDPTGYGNYIKIEDDKQGSLYAHLQSFKVNVGDQVNEGQVIGISDNTGNSTGPHLHFGYYLFPRDRSNGYSGYIDPLPYLLEQTDDPIVCDKKSVRDMLVSKATKYDEFVSAGYNSVDDVKKAIQDIKDSIPPSSPQTPPLEPPTPSQTYSNWLDKLKELLRKYLG